MTKYILLGQQPSAAQKTAMALGGEPTPPGTV